MFKLVRILLVAALVLGAFGVTMVFAQEESEVAVSGLIEAEYGQSKVDYAGGDEEGADIVTATVELGVDAKLSERAKGHVLLLWEEDDTDPIAMDEATISIMPAAKAPLWIVAGKYYLPFGNYNTWMVTDPITLEIGEINQSALGVEYDGGWFNVGGAAFNGDISDVDDDEEEVDTYVAFFNFQKGVIEAGASYLTNISDTDGLEEEVTGFNPALGGGAVDSHVPGLAAYIIVDLGRIKISGEYVGASSDFEEGELAFAVDEDGDPQAVKPSAINTEVLFEITEKMSIAGRVAVSEDLYSFMPEQQVGATFSYGLMEDTVVSAELIQGEYQDNDEGIEEEQAITLQLAMEF